ncbi:hypothetical protein GGI22_004494, partial [Coemansia erecta]
MRSSDPFHRRYASAKPAMLPAGSDLAGKSSLSPRIHEKLQILQTKYAELNQQMSGDVSKLGREELARMSKELNETGLLVTPYSRLLQHYSELV